MSDVAASPELNNLRRGMIMTSVVLAATLYSTTLVIASTLLPQIQGAMAATPDEVAWVMTFNILATAVVTPMTGWLVGCFGRRGVMVGSVLLFTLSTYLCGAAESLETLILWRILQGATGAPVTPLSQTVLFDTFSRQYQRIVTSIYGMTVVLGPIIGPVLGGYLTDMYSWRWAFYLLVPIGLASAIGLQFSMLRDTRRQPVRLDWLGFLSLAAAISFMQLALSRGPRLDWYDSPEVWLETIGAIVAFYVFLAHSLTAKNPFLHLRLLLDRNYALGLALVTVFGMLNVTPMVLLPPLLRQNMGYPDSLIGEILAWRGVGGVVGFFLASFVGRLDPRVGMSAGFGLQVVSGLWLMSIDLNVDTHTLMANSAIQGGATALIWVPLTIVGFSTLDSEHWPEAMSVFHLMRNIGSSFFISMCVAEMVRSATANYSRLNEMISPFNRQLSLPWVMGGWTTETDPGLARLAQEINRQAVMIGYLRAFTLYTAASAAALLLVIVVRSRGRTLPT
jgi:MFS transporter, DHA2 family, multidrug resistance protein